MFKIGNRLVGPGYPTYIIAEMSANHNQSFEDAVKIIEEAKNVGADAIKLQTYTADTLTIDSDEPPFQIRHGLWEGRNLYELYQEAYMPWEWQPKLKQVAEDFGLDFFSSPFDDSAVDFLETLNVPVYKIASPEIIDTGLLRKVASTGKPVIMSTGMATFEEIDEAVQTLRQAGIQQIALLKCTSAYPAPPEEANLLTIPHLEETFNVVVGLSDHTLGTTVAVSAVALGARIIEKHFTLSREALGPDSAFSLEPSEFREMVENVRTVEKALGKIDYQPGEKEIKNRAFRRSLFVVEDVQAGDKFTIRNVRSIRPGQGLPPKHFEEVLNHRAARDIVRGTPLDWNLVD